MNHFIRLLGLCLLVAAPLSAQTATFNWTSTSTANENVYAAFATVNNIPTNEAIGYAGGITLTNGSFLSMLDLPESLGFPNNGALGCNVWLTFGPKLWGKRLDGSTMDGSQVGDYYTVTGSVPSCLEWNGTASISLVLFHQISITGRSCYHGVCHTWTADLVKSGSGTATVE